MTRAAQIQEDLDKVCEIFSVSQVVGKAVTPSIQRAPTIGGSREVRRQAFRLAAGRKRSLFKVVDDFPPCRHVEHRVDFVGRFQMGSVWFPGG